jgi:SNF2 family DNA or RNA helicase
VVTLDPHQQIIHDEMIKYPRYAAFMPTGSGKTLTALEVLKTLNIKQCLIIAPKLVIANAWRAEIKRWDYPFTYHELRGKGFDNINYQANLFLTTPESLISKKLPPVLNALHEKGPIALIIDESSKFKNRNSRRTKLMLKWCKGFSHCYLLSATPAPRSLENLWPQFYFVDYGARLESTLTKYRQKYFHPVPPYEYNIWQLNSGADNRIYSKIEDRAKTVEVKYLQPYRYVNHNIPLTSPVKQKIKDLKENIIFDSETNKYTIAPNTPIKLLQMSGGACYNEIDTLTFCQAKIDYLIEFIETQQDNPVLIAYNYDLERERISEVLRKKRVKHRHIKGGMSSIKVEDTISLWNKRELQVLLAQPAAMGHGLNLQYGGNQIVWFSPPLDLELYEQLNGRLNRKGQKSAVFVHHLQMEKTADVSYYQALKTKASVQQTLLEYLTNE